MACKGMRGLNEALRTLSLSSNTCKDAVSNRLLQPAFTRSMATEVSRSHLTTSVESPAASTIYTPTTHVPVTIHSFPYLEPQRLENWSAKHLHLPLRRDLLHLAVVYEGDKTRQGTASSKTRYEVHGSHRKLYRQKGTGRARVGSKQSPLRRGGGKTFGPQPRDFSTKLNRKVYDLAWRTALSYRYRRGELVVCQDGMELPLPEEFLDIAETSHVVRELEEGFRRKFVKQIMEANEWGRSTGRTTFITGDRREELFKTMELAPEHGRALDVEDVDVKDLLETGKLVVERQALKEMIENHQSDLITRVFMNGLPSAGPASGEIAVE